MIRKFRAPYDESGPRAEQASSAAIGELARTIGLIATLAPRQDIQDESVVGTTWRKRNMPHSLIGSVRRFLNIPRGAHVDRIGLMATRYNDPRTGLPAREGVIARTLIPVLAGEDTRVVEYSIAHHQDAPPAQEYTIERQLVQSVTVGEAAPALASDTSQLDPQGYAQRLVNIEREGAIARDMGLRTVSPAEVADMTAALRAHLNPMIAAVAIQN